MEVPKAPEMLVEERLHDRFAEVVVTERVTVPANPFRGATDIVEFPWVPTFTEILEGIAAIVKS